VSKEQRAHGERGRWSSRRKTEAVLRVLRGKKSGAVHICVCPSLLAIGNRTEAPGCLVEQAVNAALNQAFHDAEALLLSRLGEVTLAMLSADFHDRLVARGGTHDLEHVHAS